MTKNIPDPRNIQYMPLAELKGDPRNPKDHDIKTIDASINRFGVLDLIVLDERTGNIISGHGRKHTLEGMQARGETPPDGIQADDDGNWLVPVVTGWASRSDTEAAAALIAMNRTTELGGWVDESLLELLDEISAETSMEGIGYDEADLAALDALVEEGTSDLDGLADEYGEPADDDLSEIESSGEAFKRLDVLWGEPKHTVHNGEVYIFDDRHVMVVAKLAEEHHLWSPYLEGRVFAPYADVYMLLGNKPKERDFLIVQPNHYLAGHILDKWTSVHGEESVTKQTKDK